MSQHVLPLSTDKTTENMRLSKMVKTAKPMSTEGRVTQTRHRGKKEQKSIIFSFVPQL